MKGSASGVTHAPSGVRGLLPDLFSFIRHPQLAERSGGWTWPIAVLLACVVAIDIGSSVGIQAALEIVDRTITALPEYITVEKSLRVQVLSMLVLAPLVEEVLFRGWLSGRKASLRFAGWGAAAFALILFSETEFVGAAWQVPVAIGLALAAFGFVQWVRTHKSDDYVPAWFTRNFHWLVWGSSLAFGLLHLGNYADVDSPFDIVAVAPEILGGLLLAYSRVRFGLRAAIAHHAAFNLYMIVSESWL